MRGRLRKQRNLRQRRQVGAGKFSKAACFRVAGRLERGANACVCLYDRRCLCDPGWSGQACEIGACPKNCSGHGTCDTATAMCACDPPAGAAVKWTGPSCSILSCSSNCTNGECVDGTCECHAGFAGVSCEDYVCLHGCYESLGRGVCRCGGCMLSRKFSLDLPCSCALSVFSL